MTNTEQREVVVRGAMLTVCAVAATVTLPMIGMIQTQKRAEADYRDMAMRLAQMEDGGAAVRAGMHASAVLDSPWMRAVEYSLERDPGSSMTRFAMRDRDGAALASLITFKPEHLKEAENIDRETHCMAQAVYYESGNEPLEGQLAVAEVVANRMADHRYPDTACDVVFQGATRTTGCQFTFTCDGALAIKPRGENWERAQRIAAHVMMGLNENRTSGATHYHATYVDPIWNQGLIRTSHVGLHIFYRFPRGAEWAQVRQDFSRDSDEADLIIASSPDADAGLEAELFDTETNETRTAEGTPDAMAIDVFASSVQSLGNGARVISAGAPIQSGPRRAEATGLRLDTTSAERDELASADPVIAPGAL